MKPESGRLIETFSQARARASPAERERYLTEACQGEPELRQQVEGLLDASERAGDFLAQTIQLQPPDAPTEGPGTAIGRYKLLQQIGEGGCGVVYMAEQEEPVRRRVALKVIKLGMDTREVIARFEAERQALALMDHPNIARVLDGGATATGRPYFVMELVRGTRITEYCDQNNLPAVERLKLFIQVCHAIQHAHQKGIIHRDIKPSNVLVSVHDDVPVPKVIDFGIAKAIGERLTDKTVFTRFEQFIGTPSYMSPEQAGLSSLDIDTRSDIYALGVLLYELLAGRPPFDPKQLAQAGMDEMLRRIREEEPPKPSTRLRTLPQGELTTTAQHRQTEPPRLISLLRGDLDWIVMKCLEKNRTRRYETANALAADLEHHLKHEPVTAAAPSTIYRMQKFVRRNQVTVGAAGLVAAALVLGILVSTWEAIRANTEAARARQAETTAAEKSAIAESQRRRAEAYLYDADMNLAGQALQQNDLGRALSFLDLHRPAKTGQRDLRGWEWRYLWGECRSDELATLGQHDGIVQSVAVSPDGKWVASGGFDGLLKIWALASEVAGGRWVTNLQLGGGPVSSVAFSPDGRWLAAGTWTNGFAVLRAPAWQWEMTVTNEVTGSLAFSGDSRLLAVGGEVWSLDTRTRWRTLPCRQEYWGEPAVAWLPNSQKLAGFGWSNGLYRVSLFDVGSTNQDATVSVIPLRAELGGPPHPTSLAFRPDENQMAVGCMEGIIRIYGGNDWRQVKTLTNHTGWVNSLAFSKDGQWLASASFDHGIKVWRTRDWEETATLHGHLEEVWAVAFTPDGQRLVSGSKDHSVRLWPVVGRSKPVEGVTVSAEDTGSFRLSGMCPFTVGPSNILTVWDGRTLQVRQRMSSYPVANVFFCRPSPDGRLLLMATAEGGLWLMDLAPGAVTQAICLQTNGSRLKEATFSEQAKWLAVADGDALRVWNLTHQRLRPGSALAAGNFWSLRFSQDEQLLGAVTGPINTELTVLVWEVASGKEMVRCQPHRDYVSGLDFSPDGTVLATVSWDNTCKLFDLRRRQEITTLRGQLYSLWSVCFSPDGRRLAAGAGGPSSRIIIWDLETDREVLVLKAHKSDLLVFHPSGDSLLCSGRSTLHLWHAPSWAEIEAAEKGKTREGKTP